MQKSWDGGGNNVFKSLRVGWMRENVIYKQDILFGAVHSYNEKETIF